MSDSLISRAKAGDVDAFEQLIKEHQKQIFNFAYKVVGNYDDASDVAQEAIIKIFKNLQYFEEKSKLTTWMYRIVTNTALDFLKKYRHNNIVSIDEPIEGEENEYVKELASNDISPQESVEKDERKLAIVKALNQISPQHRAVILLRDINGMTYEEIAQALMCSEGTVKSRINRGRKALAKILLKDKELFNDYIV